jgi:hypothetical protein
MSDSGAISLPSSPPPQGTNQSEQAMEVDEGEVQQLPSLRTGFTPGPLRMDFNSITTSDPLQQPSVQIFRANLNGKRPLIDSTEQHTTKRTHPSLNPSINDLILQARSLIVKAAGLTKAHEEQTRLLDLIEVFREYTEKGKVTTSSRIIASQVANLELTTRKIDLKAKELSKAKPTIAQVALTGANQSTNTTSYKPQEWQLVEPKKKTQTGLIRKDTSRRLILIQSGSQDPTFSPLSLRNKLNRAFTLKGYKEPVIATVSRTLTQNIVITTTPIFTSDFLIEKEAIWKGIIPYTSIRKDEP